MHPSKSIVSNAEMVNTRSGSGVDQPATPRNTNNNSIPNPAPQPNQEAPAGMEQFLAAQTQLLANMANTMTAMQVQMNNNNNNNNNN